MRVLLAAAVSLATAAVSAAGAAGPHPVNLVSLGSGTISAFAQDRSLIAWFTPNRKGCNTVHVRSLANGLHAELPRQAGARNVTCRWAVGRQPPKLIPGTSPAVAVAASNGRVAYIETGAITKSGKPVAGADATIEVVDAASGRVVSTIRPQGTPVAVALSAHVLATLEKTRLGLRLAWYTPSSGSRTATGSVPVAIATSPALTASDQLVVFHVGRSIRAVEIGTGRVRSLVTAAAAPVGLSIEGSRLAWAENRKHGARVR